MVSIVILSISLAFAVSLMINGFSGNMSSLVGGLGWLAAFSYNVGYLIEAITKYKKKNGG